MPQVLLALVSGGMEATTVETTSSRHTCSENMPAEYCVLIQFCRYGAVPPKMATATAYGKATPTVRTLVGNSSENTAGVMDSTAPMNTRMIVAGRNRDRNVWPTMALSGKNSSSGTRLPMISDGRRPQMSESLPHSGREMIRTTLANRLACRAVAWGLKISRAQ